MKASHLFCAQRELEIRERSMQEREKHLKEKKKLMQVGCRPLPFFSTLHMPACLCVCVYVSIRIDTN